MVNIVSMSRRRKNSRNCSGDLVAALAAAGASGHIAARIVAVAVVATSPVTHTPIVTGRVAVLIVNVN